MPHLHSSKYVKMVTHSANECSLNNQLQKNTKGIWNALLTEINEDSINKVRRNGDKEEVYLAQSSMANQSTCHV